MGGARLQSIKKPKCPNLRFSLRRREKPRRRPIVQESIVQPARAEVDPVHEEGEVGRVREVASSARRVFVASAVDPKIALVLESFRMRQQHASDFECAESELVGFEDLTSPTDTATSVVQPELAGYDQNIIALLLFRKCFEHLDCALVPSEILPFESTLAPVVEAAMIIDQVEYFIDRLVVARPHDLEPRNGEPSFGPGRKQPRGD